MEKVKKKYIGLIGSLEIEVEILENNEILINGEKKTFYEEKIQKENEIKKFIVVNIKDKIFFVLQKLNSQQYMLREYINNTEVLSCILY